MSAEPPFRIAYEGEDVVVRIRKGALGQEQMSQFLDFVIIRAIQATGNVTEQEAAALAREEKAAVWERMRHWFENE